MDIYSKIIDELKSGNNELDRLKINLCKECNLKRIPTNIEILMHAKEKDFAKIKNQLITKQSRTISGVTPVAVMTKPFPCPHGKCIMCPGGVNSFYGDVPQSYTGHEPATMRAMRANYDPYIQIFNRLEQYILLGHNIDKIELIIMGGTFPAMPKEYQEQFVADCFKALNDFSKLFFNKNNKQANKTELNLAKFKKFFELPHAFNEKLTAKIIDKIKKVKKSKAKLNEKISKSRKASKMKKIDLEHEQKKNETSKVRCIGLTIETRPDWGLLKQGNEMLRLGATRVELGVQTIYDDVLKAISRGHTIKQTIESIKILKDLGFKLNFHMMIGLPGSDKEKDIHSIKELFENENFQPDMLKIYPCMVSKGTKLSEMMKNKQYKPLTTQEAAERIAEAKRFVKKYCRIMRVQRDIPPKFMEAGPSMTNLRQLVHEIAKKKGIKCECIRCRELGRNISDENITYSTTKYDASDGKELFISADAKNAIVGFVRMRYPSQSLRKEITNKSALIRELHVYGSAVPIGEKGLIQHKGIGKKLMEFAEKQAKKDKKNKIIIISGIGVREYYKKLGYKLEGPYMIKLI